MMLPIGMGLQGIPVVNIQPHQLGRSVSQLRHGVFEEQSTVIISQNNF
jgi:hypothetical protein